MALRIISRLKGMGLDATPAQVFQHQTIQSLASVVTPRSSLLSVALTQPTNESFNPIPVQSWFLQLALNCPHHFNQAACIKVMRKIEPALLDEALKAVYDHHDGLRLRLRGGRLHYVEVEAPTVEWGMSPIWNLMPKQFKSDSILNTDRYSGWLAFDRTKKIPSNYFLWLTTWSSMLCPGAFCLRIYGRPIPRHPTPAPFCCRQNPQAFRPGQMPLVKKWLMRIRIWIIGKALQPSRIL